MKINNLRDYQKEAVAHCLKGNAIIAYSVGLGKTPIGCAAAVEAGTRSVLVVSPLALKEQWVEHIIEIERLYGGDAASDYSNPRLPKVTAACGRTYTIAHPEALRSGHPCAPLLYKRGQQWDAVIVDEAHRFSNSVSAQSKGLRKLNTHYKWMFSGSFIRDKVHNLFGLLNWVCPAKFSSHVVFTNTYCEMIPDKFGKRVGGLKLHKVGGKWTTEPTLKLLRYNTQGILHVKTAEEVGLELPPTNFVDIALGMDTDQAELYKKVQKEQVVWLTQEHPEVWDWTNLTQQLVITNAAARFTYLQRVTSDPQHYQAACSSAKEEWLNGYLEETDAPTLVFTRFTATAERIKEMQKKRGIVGWTVGTYDSLAEGLNLQQYSNTILWDLPLRRLHYEQGLGRTRRMGQVANQVNYFVPLIKGTLDYHLHRAIENKQSEVQAVIDWLRQIKP